MSDLTDDQLFRLASTGAELLAYRRPRCRWKPGLLQEGEHWQRTERILFGTTSYSDEEAA